MSSGQIVQERPTIAFAFETVAVSNSAQVLTAATYKPSTGASAERAFITCEGDCRYRYDGSDPTSSVGHLLRDGGYIVLKGQHQMANFKAIRTGSVNATLSVSYERE